MLAKRGILEFCSVTPLSGREQKERTLGETRGNGLRSVGYSGSDVAPLKPFKVTEFELK